MKQLYGVFAALVAALLVFAVSPAAAQPRDRLPSPAYSADLPPGISVRMTPIGEVYTDAQGHTLYGLDTSVLLVDTRTPNSWCAGSCAESWQSVAPPAGTPAAPPGTVRYDARRVFTGPDWSWVQGANGPQLMFKRWNLVFVRKGEKPASAAADGAGNGLWNALRYVPPMPTLVAPVGVTAVFLDDGYVLTGDGTHILYTMKAASRCATPCAPPRPFRSGFLGHGVGDWTISRGSDFAQWVYRGNPVFVTETPGGTADLPSGAAALRPQVEAPRHPKIEGGPSDARQQGK